MHISKWGKQKLQPVFFMAVVALSAFVPQVLNIKSFHPLFIEKVYANTESVEVRWPTEAAVVNGSQPVKALLKNTELGSYKMYWQVDGGGINEMFDNSQNLPLKENVIDYSGWTWRGNGPYMLTFTAVGNDGTSLGQKSVTVYTGTSDNATPLPEEQSPVPDSPAEDSITGIIFRNGYPMLNGDYIDCNGNVDNDMAHHTTDPGDQDPAHHVGQNCPDESMVGRAKDPQPTPEPIPPADPPSDSSNPLTGAQFYVNPNSQAKQHADNLRGRDAKAARALDKIASQPQAVWLGGWNGDVKGDVEKVMASGAVPVFIAYNVPQRDCGGYSAGGVNSINGYKEWIAKIAAGINNRKAVVVLEPDALTLTNCLSEQDQQTRFSLLAEAAATLKSAGAVVYLDAGHSEWISAGEMASRLQKAGIDKVNGFALNVSNFVGTDNNVRYGENISQLLGGKHFIVDTARNGRGPASGGEWCNPPGRGLGQKPTVSTGNRLVDAFLWLKTPGESDGNCNGGPNAGVFWLDYALGLAERASW